MPPRKKTTPAILVAKLPEKPPANPPRLGLKHTSLIYLFIAFSSLTAALLAFQKMKTAVDYAADTGANLLAAQKQNEELSGRIKDIQTISALKNRIPAEKPAAAPLFASVPADWQDFSIEKLGLSFSYPSKWGKATAKSLKTDKGGGMEIAFSEAPDSHLYFKSREYVATPNSPAEFGLPETAPASCDGLAQGSFAPKSCLSFPVGSRKAFVYSVSSGAGDLYGDRWSAAYYTGSAEFPVLTALVSKKTSNDITELGRLITSIK
jgi:hypothetical protein